MIFIMFSGITVVRLFVCEAIINFKGLKHECFHLVEYNHSYGNIIKINIRYRSK